MKTVLITGATSGIGEACAHIFAENGYRLIITGRREEKLKQLAQTFQTQYGTNTLPLVFDVTDKVACENAITKLPTDYQQIDILINNAGLAAGLNPIHEGLHSDWETMIDTNIKGLLYMTRIVAPMMVLQQAGHIINISSIAGKENYANGNVYCATKHAVDSLSQTMRIDLLQHGIRVTNIAPGMVETEFSLVRYKGDSERAKKVYAGLTPLSAHDVADAVYWAASRPEHVNISDITITPKAQANATTTFRK